MLAESRVQTTLPVTDLDGARAFYEGVLGYSPLAVTPIAVIYGAGQGTSFAVSRSNGRPSGTHTQMAIGVDDIEVAVAELKGRGVLFEEYDLPNVRTVGSIGALGPNRAAWFKDPAGNLIGVVQYADAGSSSARGSGAPGT